MSVSFSVPTLPLNSVYKDYRFRFNKAGGWRHKINIANFKYVAIHHSVTTAKNSLDKEVDEIHKLHLARGWGGIGYNFIISSEIDPATGLARVAYANDLALAGAHTPNKKGAFGIKAGFGNEYIIGICIIGRFDLGQTPSNGQLKTAHELVNELVFNENRRMPNIADTWLSMKKHKDFDPTACCGTFDLNLIRDIYLAETPPQNPVQPPVVTPKPVVTPPAVIDLQAKIKELEIEINTLKNERNELINKNNKLQAVEDELALALEQHSKMAELANSQSLEIDRLQTQLAEQSVQNVENKKEKWNWNKYFVGLSKFGLTDAFLVQGLGVLVGYLSNLDIDTTTLAGALLASIITILKSNYQLQKNKNVKDPVK